MDAEFATLSALTSLTGSKPVKPFGAGRSDFRCGRSVRSRRDDKSEHRPRGGVRVASANRVARRHWAIGVGTYSSKHEQDRAHYRIARTRWMAPSLAETRSDDAPSTWGSGKPTSMRQHAAPNRPHLTDDRSLAETRSDDRSPPSTWGSSKPTSKATTRSPQSPARSPKRDRMTHRPRGGRASPSQHAG
jgi:hypothetical protein